MNPNRNKKVYFALIVLTIIAGLLARRFNYIFNDYINTYLGDALWALMIYLIAAFLLPRYNALQIAFISLIFCFSIEASQLYHAEWIDSIRANKLGALVLGSGFLWTDMVAYNLGVGFAGTLELIIYKSNRK